VEWLYYLNPNTLKLGGGSNSKETAGLYFPTCKSIPTVSCAAFAITYWLVMNKSINLSPVGGTAESFKTHINRKHNQEKVREAAKELQDRLGWEKITTVDQTKEILNLFKDHRLVIIQPFAKKSIAWSGQDYIPSTDKKIIYIYYDHLNLHFCAVKAPQKFINQIWSENYRWCHDCASFFNPRLRLSCGCDGQPRKDGYKRKKPCISCGELILNQKSHRCDYQKCITCKNYLEKGPQMTEHRCPLNIDIDSIPKDFESGHKKAPQLWVYDIESCIVLAPQLNRDMVFMTDENGYHSRGENGLPRNYLAERHYQVPNLLIYMNIFTGEFRKTSSIETFIRDMLTINKGNNIVLAHNASGYDSRLIFEELAKIVGEKNEIKAIMRGGKFMRLCINKTIFLDSMLHVVGSLKSLAKDYLKGGPVQLAKGYFPHLFNKAINYNYVGPIPPKEDFDLSFSINTEGDLEEFNEWYATWEGRDDWNFKKEIELYCENDVRVLAEIVRSHHYLCMKAFGKYRPQLAISPWHYPTAAGYVHKLFLYENEFNEMGETEEENIHRAKTSWAVLQPEEYYFARGALRGGRTEVRKFYHEGPIRDQDIQSQYPYCQMGKSIKVVDRQIEILYPVGTPTIEIHDDDYYPCNLHYETPERLCNCQMPTKMKFKNKKTIVRQLSVDNLHEYIENFFGIIMVDVLPPNHLYHPVLPTFDPVRNKCLFSLDPIERQRFCSVELKVAIDMGYVVTKIYRADRYEAAPSKWKGLLGAMYKLKLYNSQKAEPNDQNIFNETTQEWQDRQQHYYKENFNMDIDFVDWDKRPAAKKTGKILCNSGWGKHAETVDHQQVKILSNDMQEAGEMFFQAVEEDHYKLDRIQIMGPSQTMFRFTEKRKKLHPKLHKGYLPCSIFVPMYGRLMLYNELHYLGERVLMVDTDSVKYIDEEGGYEIAKGDCLGDFEEESLDRTIEFVSIGLKSYGQMTESGKESFKSKGVCIKRCHKLILNFDIAKKILMEGYVANISQMTFDYTVGKGISKRTYIKEVKFQPHILKGEYDPASYKLYPFGYHHRE
jgi:hypothetical protein